MSRQNTINSRQQRFKKQSGTRGRLRGRKIPRRGRKSVLRRSGRRKRSASEGAKSSLKQFRQASILSVAVTALLLMVISPGQFGVVNEAEAANTDSSNVTQTEVVTASFLQADNEDLTKTTYQLLDSAQNLWEGFYTNLPRLLAVVVIFFLAWLMARLLAVVIRKLTRSWQKSSAAIAISRIVVWLMAAGIALSVVAGDLSALLGSLGLVGLALSWALQTPIESFTGWLLNSFQSYYRVGDRIAVDDIYGDVYKIDFLTTTIWEMGGPYKVGFVNAEQPTGKLVTFANNEILSGSIVNFTRDFPYVWDEYAVQIANESDIAYSMELMRNIANDLLGNMMVEPAKQYEKILQRAHLEFKIAGAPEIFLASQASWTEIVIRYLVPARERRKWKSELTFRITTELQKPEVGEKIITAYQRQQVQFLNNGGVPVNAQFFGE